MTLHMPVHVQHVGEEAGEWTNINWGKAKLTPTLVTIQRLYSAFSLPLRNLCVPEKD